MNLNVLDAYGCVPTLFPATLCRVLACQPWSDLGWTSSLQPSTKHGQNMKSEREREEGGGRREEGGGRREEGGGRREEGGGRREEGGGRREEGGGRREEGGGRREEGGGRREEGGGRREEGGGRREEGGGRRKGGGRREEGIPTYTCTLCTHVYILLYPETTFQS